MMLTNIEIVLQDDGSDFFERLFSYLNKFGTLTKDSLIFNSNENNYFPIISIKKGKINLPKVRFYSNEEIINEIKIENITGKKKNNPSKYSKISLDLFCKRFDEKDIIKFGSCWL